MKALIAMSGGVDSSVAALLTKQKGFDCVGCTMKLYSDKEYAQSQGKTCCTADDVEDARSVASRLDMPYYVFNFTDDFKEKVIDDFINCYFCGRTPNPCIECNRIMKFGKLYERAKLIGRDYIVTGHYARIEKTENGYLLKKAVDESKDQSYVLYSLTQELLAHTLFPLGELTKAEARKIAEENGFINANKPDSQDICFVPDGDYAKVIEKYTSKKAEPGDFVDKAGNVLGRHRGIIHYTIGQRRGLGISSDEPLYVCGIDVENNTVILGRDSDLFTKELNVRDFNWISGNVPTGEICCKVKIRYKHQEQPATVIPTGNDTVRVIFDEPQRAITPGQSAVAYDGEVVLGGGKIF